MAHHMRRAKGNVGVCPDAWGSQEQEYHAADGVLCKRMLGCGEDILAEGAIALSVTLSGGALFAS